MSLFRWFTAKNNKHATTVPPDSSGLAHADPTLPLRTSVDVHQKDGYGNAANRKSERLERREMLYAIVRECMTRAGVLSSTYKFKVLSLDSRGRQYLIMMDLPHDQAGNTTRLAEIEGLIAHAAKTSHDILVTAVYWRVNEHVTAGLSRPAPKSHETAPPASAIRAHHVPAEKPLFEPLQDDEVVAFKRALASGAPAAAIVQGTVFTSGPRNPDPMPQFQDTEIDEIPLPLSATQYGDLK
jgi:hypothetical protein